MRTPHPSPETLGHLHFQGTCWEGRIEGTEGMQKLLYAGQSAWVPARETEAQLVGRRLSAQCLVVCSNLHNNPGKPRVQMGRPRCKGVKPHTQGLSPGEGQGPGKCHGPDLWPAWFCARGTLVSQGGYARAPSMGRMGGTKARVCSVWCLQGRGLRPASAWRSRRRPHPGSQPKSASPPGNSRLPPLPGLAPASTHMPTLGGCLAPPSKPSRAV